MRLVLYQCNKMLQKKINSCINSSTGLFLPHPLNGINVQEVHSVKDRAYNLIIMNAITNSMKNKRIKRCSKNYIFTKLGNLWSRNTLELVAYITESKYTLIFCRLKCCQNFEYIDTHNYIISTFLQQSFSLIVAYHHSDFGNLWAFEELLSKSL